MGLDVYFKEDIQQSVIAVTLAMLTTAQAHNSTNIDYCWGIVDAAHAQAANYGLSWPDIRQALTEALHDDAKTKLITDLLPPS